MENAYNRHIFNASFPANLTSAPRDANAAPLCRPPCQLPAVPFLEKGSEGCWELIASQKLLARRVPRGLELLADCQARPTSSGLIKASYGFQAFFLPPPPFPFVLCNCHALQMALDEHTGFCSALLDTNAYSPFKTITRRGGE